MRNRRTNFSEREVIDRRNEKSGEVRFHPATRWIRVLTPSRARRVISFWHNRGKIGIFHSRDNSGSSFREILHFPAFLSHGVTRRARRHLTETFHRRKASFQRNRSRLRRQGNKNAISRTIVTTSEILPFPNPRFVVKASSDERRAKTALCPGPFAGTRIEF